MKKNVLITNILIASVGIITIMMLAAYFVAPQAVASFDSQNRPTPTPEGKVEPIEPIEPVEPVPEHPTEGSGDTNTVELHGAFIELVGTNATQNLWSVVQWQGVSDGWHDVDGWRGTFDPNNMVRWWVGHENLGSGPFRWIVYEGETAVFTSDPFQLPANVGDVTRITFDNNMIEQPTTNAGGVTHTAVANNTVNQHVTSNYGLSMSEAQFVNGVKNGFIILQRALSSPVSGSDELWTQVEWQDPAGVWHNVDGWAGSFNESGQVTWWVIEEHAGTYPFRWVVYKSEMNKTAVSISSSFSLPYSYDNVQVKLTN